jgi:hypothetical protein
VKNDALNYFDSNFSFFGKTWCLANHMVIEKIKTVLISLKITLNYKLNKSFLLKNLLGLSSD